MEVQIDVRAQYRDYRGGMGDYELVVAVLDSKIGCIRNHINSAIPQEPSTLTTLHHLDIVAHSQP